MSGPLIGSPTGSSSETPLELANKGAVPLFPAAPADKVLLNPHDPTDPYQMTGIGPVPKKAPGITRIWVDGCFDMLHFGHTNALRQARMLGPPGKTELFCGTHSDIEIEKVKGPPIMHEEERYEALRHCKFVDFVVENYPYSTRLKDMSLFEIDFVAHGDDVSTDADGRNSYQEMIDAGKFRVFKRTDGISTTDLVGRMLLCTKQHMVDAPSSDVARQVSEQVSEIHSASSAAAAAASSSAAEQPVFETIRINQVVIVDGKHYIVSAAGAVPTLKAITDDEAQKLIELERAEHDKKKQHHHNHQRAGSNDGNTTPRGGLSAPLNYLTPSRKIVQFSNNSEPNKQSKIVYVCGGFDLFHIGHMRLLQLAKQIVPNAYVVAGICDDKVINQNKGDTNYPIMNLNERVLGVLSCRWVDEVIMGVPYEITEELMQKLKIDVVVIGATRDPRDTASMRDTYGPAERAGKLMMVDTRCTLTTSSLVDRVVSQLGEFVARQKKKAVKDKASMQNKPKEYQDVREM